MEHSGSESKSPQYFVKSPGFANWHIFSARRVELIGEISWLNSLVETHGRTFRPLDLFINLFFAIFLPLSQDNALSSVGLGRV